MGLTFDAPISAATSAYDKAHRRQPTASALPSSKARNATSASSSISNSFLHNVCQYICNPFHRPSTSISISPPSKPGSAPSAAPSKPVPAADSPFFRLPLEIRETIYGHVVGQYGKLHIMIKRRPSRPRQPLGHRRCPAGGNPDDCILKSCSQFLDEGSVTYFGPFSDVGGLLFSCQDIYREVSNVLYTQNTFDFDHPQSVIVFSKTVSPASLNSIKSISINLRMQLFAPPLPVSRIISFCDDEWPRMWTIISEMEGLEEIRVGFRFPINNWFAWSEEEALEPLWKVTRPMRVFEVDARRCIGFKLEDTAAREYFTKAPFKVLRSLPKHEA